MSSASEHCRRTPRPYDDHAHQRISYKPICLHPFCRGSVCRPSSRQDSYGNNFPAVVSATNHIPHCSVSLPFVAHQPTKVPSRINLPTNLRPRRGAWGGQSGGAEKIISWERYDATTKQIRTPFQLYDLQLLVFLVFS